MKTWYNVIISFGTYNHFFSIKHRQRVHLRVVALSLYIGIYVIVCVDGTIILACFQITPSYCF